jgi:hypothetical protein
MRKLIPLLIVMALINSSCIAALIGGVAYKSSKTKGQRQEFMTAYQKTNMEREVHGLKPLDWCSEAYRFDEGWANNEKRCAERIKAYKKGDQAALDIDSGKPLMEEPAKGESKNNSSDGRKT